MDDSTDGRADLELIEALTAQWLEGDISEANGDKLNDLLLGSYEGRRLFLQHAHIEAGLHWLYAGRKQVATVIDRTLSGGVRPVADIAQQQLRFADDVNFIHVMRACSSNESHSQDWLQLFPRILAVTSLRVSPAANAAKAVKAVVDKLLVDYMPEMSPAAFWAATTDATIEAVLAASSNDADQAAVTHALLDCAFASPDEAHLLDAISIHEILDECIPHRLPADTLRVLCLRYLHNLPPHRIALHLNRSPQQIQLHLAKVRVHLVNRCLAGAGAEAGELDLDELVTWSRLLDAPTHEAKQLQSRVNKLQSGVRDATHLLLLAIVHDYLGRGLSPKRLLDEIPSQRNKSYLRAIEQSLRDIETLGATQARSANSLPRGSSFSRTSRQLAAIGAIAAGLLVAVGFGVWMGQSRDVGKVAAVTKQATDESRPALPPEREVVEPVPQPVEMPVIAAISEAIGLPARDRDRLTVGSAVRIQDVIAFERGIVQLSTTSGSTLVLEGPVDARVLDKNHLSLRRGKITGLNNNVGESLTIDSPTSSIVDVGTEFGVSVSESQETDVAVYEGEVWLESLRIPSESAPAKSLQLTAGWETSIDAAAASPAQPVPLSHDRGFVRADEVQLRKEAQRGNLESAAKVAFYEMLRIKGLIAYQGFHQNSLGAEFSHGFRSPEIRQTSQPSFGMNIVKSSDRLGSSHSLVVEKDVTTYVDLDVSRQSRAVLAGVVDEGGQIGSRPAELWICWRTKAFGPQGTEFKWAGVSLMHGDNRSVDEPLFVGQPEPLSHLGYHIYNGRGEPLEAVRTLDKDAKTPGDQPRLPDFSEHVWLVRLRMDGGTTTEAAFWCDVLLDSVADTPPAAVQAIPDFRFDRLRFEAHPLGDEGGWQFDDIIIAQTSDAIAAAVDIVTH